MPTQLLASTATPKEGRTTSFSRRCFLPASPTYLWRIETGVVRTLTWLEDGTIVTLGIWSIGDMVGQALSKSDPYRIEALTPTEVTPISFPDWSPTREWMLNYAQQTEVLLLARACVSAEEKLLKILSWLASKFGNETEQGFLINLQLTHQDLAELVGLTRVTVTRILSQLEQQGFIHRLSRRLVVVKEEKLWHYEI